MFNLAFLSLSAFISFLATFCLVAFIYRDKFGDEKAEFSDNVPDSVKGIDLTSIRLFSWLVLYLGIMVCTYFLLHIPNIDIVYIVASIASLLLGITGWALIYLLCEIAIQLRVANADKVIPEGNKVSQST